MLDLFCLSQDVGLAERSSSERDTPVEKGEVLIDSYGDGGADKEKQIQTNTIDVAT